MAILRLLSLDAGRIVELGYLAAEVWGTWGPSEETILRTYIKFLRRKLDALVAGHPVIASVRGRGYRLDVPVEPVPAGADGSAIMPPRQPTSAHGVIVVAQHRRRGRPARRGNDQGESNMTVW
jgi:DNA-binding winged helix-turn-helix (wHTH) protein